MNNFLKECRTFLQLQNLCIVLCNESCDLDSAISSLTLAYHLHENFENISLFKQNYSIVPVLNVPKIELPIKTEVTYFLKQNKIDLEDLICVDELDTNTVEKFILVDHHVSKFHDKVLMVFDHRPFDKNSNLPINAEVIIEQVGSCCSLLMNYIKSFDCKNSAELPVIMKLLYGPIVLDTVNFSKEADRARPLDFEMADFIEKSLKIENSQEHRLSLFEQLVKARSDVTSLNSYQILFKDLKIISSKNKNNIVSIPGYPILVQDFIKKDENVEENLNKFATDTKADVILLMGLKIINNEIFRDIGIINIKNLNLFEAICDSLLNSQDFQFNFEQYDECNLMNGKFFKQKNIKLSRKQILPIIKNILDEI